MHKIFEVPENRYIWHSQSTFNTTDEALELLLGNYEYHKEDTESTLNIDTEDFTTYIKTAKVIWCTFRNQKALHFFKTILALQPNHADSHFYIAQIYQFATADYDLAIQHYNRYIELQPKHIPANNFFIDTWFDRYHTYEPNVLEAYTFLADIYYYDYKNTPQAIELLEKVLQIDRTHHLSPLLKYADLNPNITALKYYKCLCQKQTNFINTTWKTYGSGSSCVHYPKLNEWSEIHYPFTYIRLSSNLDTFIPKFNKAVYLLIQYNQPFELIVDCYNRLYELYNDKYVQSNHKKLQFIFQNLAQNILSMGDYLQEQNKPQTYAFALKIYSQFIKTTDVIKYKKTFLKEAIQKIQAERLYLLFNVYKDYWQMKSLLNDLLKKYPNNKQFKAYVKLIKSKY